MLAHGIEPDENWIYYGDFWKQFTTDFADRLASGEIEMPEAVACAATAPAISLIERLRVHHIRVPDDLAVVGYDFSMEGEYCDPTITSISFPFYNQGVHAMCQIHQALTGKQVQSVPLIPEDVRVGGSCGCTAVSNEIMKRYKYTALEFHEYRDLFRNSGLQESISSAETVQEFFARLTDLNYLIRGIQTVRYFLCDDWDGIHNQQDDEYRRVGYSEQLYVYSHAYPQSVEYAVKKKKDILSFVSNAENPATYFFMPMHYSDRAFGFACLEYKEIRFAPDELFWTYLEILNNSLEILRIRQYLTRFHERVELTAVRDRLTNVYNQRGFEEISLECFENSVIHRTPFHLIEVKLFNLEEINRAKGYQYGDWIIAEFAKLLCRCCHESETVCRIKGGDFFIVGSFKNYERPHISFSDKLQEMLAKNAELSVCRYDLAMYHDVPSANNHLSDIVSKLNSKIREHHLNAKKRLSHIATISDLRQAIYDDPAHKWSIDEMARVMMLSRGYFQRMYKKQFGVSASADVIAARITLAKKLLSQGKSIYQVSEQCGYHQESYFMQQFKRETGMTPTEYRDKSTTSNSL